MPLQDELQKILLNEKEAELYLAALELGPTSIQNLTKKSGIKRSTIYDLLRNLKGMGLISETTKGKRKLIVASDPEVLKRTLKDKEKLLGEIMPELRSLVNVGFVKPRIMFFEGRDGLREIWRDTLKIKSKMTFWISPVQDLIETVGEEFVYNYIEERAKKGIWIKSIHVTQKQVPTYKYLNPITYERTLRQVRFTPKEINIQNTIIIYDNKVAIISTRKEGFGFVVESADYAISMMAFYDLLWNICKPYGDMEFQQTAT